jgi:site-specific DNA recombinase
MKTIIYCRKSSESEDRQVQSLESQLTELKAIAAKRELDIDKIFTESMSAKAPGRPVFNEMLSYVQKHKDCVILTWKLDRLARNPIDQGQISWLLQKSVIKEIVTYEKSYHPDDNILAMSVESAMANQYVRDLAVNIKRGNRTRLEKGGLPGPAPVGYLDNKATKFKDIDPIKAPLVKQAFELYASGSYSLRDLSRLMHAKGLRTCTGRRFSKAMMHRLLSNPFYYGVIRRLGQYYPGNHQPIITKTLFDRAQDVLSGKTRARGQRLFFPLRGYMQCAHCNCLLTVSRKKGHVYYYCTNGKGNCNQHKSYLKEKSVNELVAKVLSEIKFDQEMVEITYLAAKEKTLRKGDTLQTHKQQLDKQLKIVQDKLSNLTDILSADPAMKEALRPKILSVEQEIKLIQEQMSALEHNEAVDPLVTLEQTKKAFLQACSASFDYLEADDNKKSVILKNLLWNLKVQDQKVQQYQLKQPFQLMAEAPKNMDLSLWWTGWDSNPRPSA